MAALLFWMEQRPAWGWREVGWRWVTRARNVTPWSATLPLLQGPRHGFVLCSEDRLSAIQTQSGDRTANSLIWKKKSIDGNFMHFHLGPCDGEGAPARLLSNRRRTSTDVPLNASCLPPPAWPAVLDTVEAGMHRSPAGAILNTWVDASTSPCPWRCQKVKVLQVGLAALWCARCWGLGGGRWASWQRRWTKAHIWKLGENSVSFIQPCRFPER